MTGVEKFRDRWLATGSERPRKLSDGLLPPPLCRCLGWAVGRFVRTRTMRPAALPKLLQPQTLQRPLLTAQFSTDRNLVKSNV